MTHCLIGLVLAIASGNAVAEYNEQNGICGVPEEYALAFKPKEINNGCDEVGNLILPDGCAVPHLVATLSFKRSPLPMCESVAASIESFNMTDADKISFFKTCIGPSCCQDLCDKLLDKSCGGFMYSVLNASIKENPSFTGENADDVYGIVGNCFFVQNTTCGTSDNRGAWEIVNGGTNAVCYEKLSNSSTSNPTSSLAPTASPTLSDTVVCLIIALVAIIRMRL